MVKKITVREDMILMAWVLVFAVKVFERGSGGFDTRAWDAILDIQVKILVVLVFMYV